LARIGAAVPWFAEDLKLRNRSPRTVGCFVRHVANFAKHFGRSPE
jgi:hypothetical protein